MSIPHYLQEAIEKELAGTPFSALADARASLTDKYRDPSRNQKKQTFMTEDLQRKSYLATRLPATYAVVCRVLQEMRERTSEPIKTILDVGSGPGTALLAAYEVFSETTSFQAIEQDSSLIAIGKRLASFEIDWKQGDMRTNEFAERDLIIFSYSLGELTPLEREAVIQKAWQAAKKLLVVIEPGTMHGFACIRAARQQLIDLQGYPVAPCPHALSCPMPKDDWCHFFERIERSSAHRRLKQGSLGYEDEKFSYFIASKTPVALPEARILRHPQQRSGHIQIVLCTPEGIKKETISKREGELYKKARKLEWGDSLGSLCKDNNDTKRH